MSVIPTFQFYAVLDDFKPKMWRRFQVASNITVARLGYIVQVLFEMQASHLMAIEVPVGKNRKASIKKRFPDKTTNAELLKLIGNTVCRYEIPHEDCDFYPSDDETRTADATQVRLKAALDEVGDELSVNYDFGDDWMVSLKLEKVIQPWEDSPKTKLPCVLEGAGYGIIEDCGGAWGLMELVECFKTKEGDEYEHYSEWLGKKDFDITKFDLDDMNFRLTKIPAIYKKLYEDGIGPTKQSIDLLERKYLKK